MARYGLTEDLIVLALRRPDQVVSGYGGRKIVHKFMNKYVLRVVYEEDDDMFVVTVYPARRERYGRAAQES